MSLYSLKKIINKEVCDVINSLQEENNLNEEQLDESGFSRLVRSLAGLEPNIETIGIITAENPMAQSLTPEENKLRNLNLTEDLRKMGYGFYQIKGKYGNVEKPFVIPNIARHDIVELGKKYEQETVIWVIKMRDGSMAELIETQDDKAIVRSRVVLPVASDAEDFYSLYKGRKFVIPFFDDLYKHRKLVRGRIV